MPSWSYPDPEELEPSEQELRDAEQAAKAQQESASIGGIAGTALGSLGYLIPGVGPIAGPVTQLLGSQVGQAIGGEIGKDAAQKAEERLRKKQAARAKKLTALEMRERALDELLAQE